MKSLTTKIKFEMEMDEEYLGDSQFTMKKQYLGNTKQIFDQFFGELLSLEKEGAKIISVFTKYEF